MKPADERLLELFPGELFPTNLPVGRQGHKEHNGIRLAANEFYRRDGEMQRIRLRRMRFPAIVSNEGTKKTKK